VDSVIAAASLPHLPAALPVLFLPTQQVGLSIEHIRFPGTLTLSAQTLIALWTELGACVARAGLRKLVLFNSHGGQVSVMDIVARDLRTAHDLIVYSANWFTCRWGRRRWGLFPPEEHRFGIHGGDIETSMMLRSAAATWSTWSQAQHFPHELPKERAARYPVLGNGRSGQAGLADAGLPPAGSGRQRCRGNASRQGACPDRRRAGLQRGCCRKSAACR
jgi:creatinine amidohydrolase